MNFLNNTFITLETAVGPSDSVIFAKKFAGNLGENFPLSAVMAESDDSGKVVKREIIKITGRNGAMLNVERAVEACPQSDEAENHTQNPLNFSENAVIFHSLTAGDLKKIAEKIEGKLDKNGGLRTGFSGNKFLIVKNNEEKAEDVEDIITLEDNYALYVDKNDGGFGKIDILSMKSEVNAGQAIKSVTGQDFTSGKRITEKVFPRSSERVGGSGSFNTIRYFKQAISVSRVYIEEMFSDLIYFYFINLDGTLTEQYVIHKNSGASLDVRGTFTGIAIRGNTSLNPNQKGFEGIFVEGTTYIPKRPAVCLLGKVVHRPLLRKGQGNISTEKNPIAGSGIRFAVDFDVKLGVVKTFCTTTTHHARILLQDDNGYTLKEAGTEGLNIGKNVFDFEGYALQKGVVYRLVLKNTDFSASKKIECQENAFSFAVSGIYDGNNIYYYDFPHFEEIEFDYGNKIFLTSLKDFGFMQNYVGFLKNMGEGLPVTVMSGDGSIYDGFEGLSFAKTYYLEHGAGMITPRVFEPKIPVGEALTATSLQKKGLYEMIITKDINYNSAVFLFGGIIKIQPNGTLRISNGYQTYSSVGQQEVFFVKKGLYFCLEGSGKITF